uniref:Transposase, MuDR, MULE transposase domain protein n=1 Tax=Tanacetum cinerariifolium TaxID=118510 RepID=A0A699HBY1_TANCI|nr:transposase, MuDR, MULE transposase domain protein [Tanacetum cinerariifolium]
MMELSHTLKPMKMGNLRWYSYVMVLRWPLIIIDAAHLKGRYKGTNLVVVAMDGNNQIVPIAVGVIQGETGASWTWFLSRLKECIGKVPNMCIISNRHPSIILACQMIFSNSFHGYCDRHLMMNCNFKGKRVVKDLWEKVQLLMKDSGLAVHVFKQGDDPIDVINKMMSFLSTVVTSRFPSTNNQLRNSSNPRQQATIHDGRVTVQPLQGRKNSYAAGTSGTRANTSGRGGNNSGQQRVVKCCNCQKEGHMARQCLNPNRKRDATWFREKILLVKAQGNGKVHNKEEFGFLADHGIVKGPITQLVITHNAAYKADNLDAYDSDCDEISTAKAVLLANLSSYGLYVLSDVPISDNTNNVMLNHSVQDMPYSEPSHLVEHP